MINNRLLYRTAPPSSRGGFTLVELLVVIGIIAILAGVALGPITSGIEKAKESSGMQSARSINLLLFAYSNDNNQTYAPGTGSSNPANPAPTNVGKSEGIAQQLLQNGYATDPTVFALTSAHKYAGTGTPYTDFSKANIDFDFTGGATTATGITSSVPDQTPTVFSTGGTVSSYKANATLALTSAGTASVPPFGLNGACVAYKSNSAVFIKATVTAAGASTVSNFISASFNDTTDTFTQIAP